MTIKELRLQKGMTLANFAKSIGIGMSTLTGYEAGKRQPGEKALAAIKEVYGVDLAAPAAPAPAAVETAPATPAKEKKAAAKKPAAKKEKAAKAEKAAPAPKKEKAAKTEKAAPAPKKENAVKAEEPAPAAKKEKAVSAKKVKATAAKKVEIIIQSPMGGEITPEDILAKAGNADKVYVRVDQNKLYIVNGEETSSVDLW